MQRVALLLGLAFLMTSALAEKPAVRTGLEVLCNRGFDILQGKRVGLVTNATGVDSRLRSTIDLLAAAPGVRLMALFGPEHGVRGNVAGGDKIESSIDPRTSLPVYSLYGKTTKPTPEMLKDIDILVYDIQDVGCRSYTFIWTMGLAMEAAAEADIPFVVLDRPNPLNGLRMEGNIAEPDFLSPISPFPIPYIYGLTCGELARLLNEEGMLGNGVRCNLTVVPLEGWRRAMTFEQTGLPWVPTSPHIPHPLTAFHYASTGIFGELHSASIGIGSTIPFETFAAEWIDPTAFADRMNALGLDGVLFRPITFTPFYGARKGTPLHGVHVHFTDCTTAPLLSLQYLLMQAHNELYPDKNLFALADTSRLLMFDKAAGTEKVRQRFQTSFRYADIKEFLGKDVEAFRRTAARYFLYHEGP